MRRAALPCKQGAPCNCSLGRGRAAASKRAFAIARATRRGVEELRRVIVSLYHPRAMLLIYR